MEGKVTG
jgi:hypothetical protein